MNPPEPPQPQPRVWIVWAFNAVEDVVHVGLALLLAGSAIALLVIGLIDFGQSVLVGKVRSIELLERGLLILLVVELLYTLQVSFRKHALVPSRSCSSASFRPFAASWSLRPSTASCAKKGTATRRTSSSNSRC